jgi:AraC-like DNA-binding protein
VLLCQRYGFGFEFLRVYPPFFVFLSHLFLLFCYILRLSLYPNLSSQMIGEYLGMSNRYVMYKFTEATGKSLNDYIVEVRMRKAANLLRNASYFYRFFRKAYNYTPRDFSEKFRES